MRYYIKINAMGAVRQNRSDAWKKRSCVVRYWAYKDALRAACKGVVQDPVRVDIYAWITMPESWSKKKRAEMDGTLHRQKPDIDNIAKGVFDALWEQDSVIAIGNTEKRWTSGEGCIVVVIDAWPIVQVIPAPIS